MKPKLSKDEIELPYNLNSEILAKSFMKFVSNRYPTGDKLRYTAVELGIEDNIEAQIIIFSQYRDAIRHTSPRLYQSPQHKEDIYVSILEALEHLEKILDEGDLEEG